MSLYSKDAAATAKSNSIPMVLNESALKDMIKRIAGDIYADSICFSQIEPTETGMDRYIISDIDSGRILIEATSGVAAASALCWYFENKCNSYIGPLTRRLAFPEVPPKSGTHSDRSVCLYRYFLNFCTYGYTLAFWEWDEWQNLLDWMMLSGYNLILNPLGNESVWINVLTENGYTREEARNFLCAPAFYPWQCMINIESYGGPATDIWYEKRLNLSKRINEYLRSFGAGIMLPGYCGMVPSDFKKHFPDSEPMDQGLWCDMPRPSLILPSDNNFERIAKSYYRNQKELFGGDINYFSTDPFHEGGNSEGVDLESYAKESYSYMCDVSEHPVWFLQGWQNNPLRKMLRALSPENVLIGNLRSTDKFDGGDNFADYPWLYCCVNNFGGQRNIRGNMNKMLTEAIKVVKDDNYSSVGIGIMPEGIETDEILFDIFASYAVHDELFDPEQWLKDRIKIRYGKCTPNTLEAFRLMCNDIYVSDTEKVARESALLTRPSLTIDKVSFFSTNEFSFKPENLYKVFSLMMKDFDKNEISETYKLDLIDIARQSIGYLGWDAIVGIQNAYEKRDSDALENNASTLMKLYDIQEKLLCCDKHTMLGPWLEKAKTNGSTPAEKAYFEFMARTIITVWGDREGATTLFDYAAKEWSGLIEDFYRPRWESYINILRISLFNNSEPLEYNRYDAEYYFTTLSKSYPTEPYGNLEEALKAALDVIEKAL